MTPAEQIALAKAVREYVYQVHVHHGAPTRQEWRLVVSREEQLFTALRPCERQGSVFDDDSGLTRKDLYDEDCKHDARRPTH